MWRGAGTHSYPTLLGSLVTHDPVWVLTQRCAAPHQHEIKAVAHFLAGRDVTGLAVTLDAGLTDAKLVQHIGALHDQYLMIVKCNQARWYEKMTWYFDMPPLPCDRPWRTSETLTKERGRLEYRLTCTDHVDSCLTWPGVQ